MQIRMKLVVFLALGLSPAGPSHSFAQPALSAKKVQVLLLGDSTCIGSVCRMVAPKADHLENVIEKLLAAEKELPPAAVLNQGRDGEMIESLLGSGRYAREIAPLKDLDYIFIRYGINDRGRRQDFAVNFPKDYRKLLDLLAKDHPKAKAIPTTIIPYMGEQRDKEVNDIVRAVAAERKLPLFDLHARYAAELKHGVNMLNYRRFAMDMVPAKYRTVAAPFNLGGSVVVMDNTLDAHLGNLPGWYGDRHPNLAGYHVIGDETARYLAPLLRNRKH